MFMSLLILLAMPILDTSRVRGSQFRPLMRVLFILQVVNFFILMAIGGLHVEDPFITVGAVCTAFYFIWFIVLVPIIGIIENTLMDIALAKKTKTINILTSNFNPVLNFSTLTKNLAKVF